MESQTLLDDILALIKQREVTLDAERAQLGELRAMVTTSPQDAPSEAPANGGASTLTRKHRMSPAARKAVSLRMKRYWRNKRRAAK